MYLKKILLPLLIILGTQNLVAQVVLSSQPLELKKSSGYHTSLMATDTENKNLVVFAADKENLKALHYNSVLFFMDSLAAKRPESKYEFMAGYSFAENGPVQVYWASLDYRHIQCIGFDFANKKVASADFELPFKDEDILSAFSDNNSFYIITVLTDKENRNKLKFYVFNNGRYETKTADFSAVTFLNTANKNLTLNNLIEDYGLQKIEVKGFTGLPETSRKIKFYVTDGKMLLTMDHNETATQLLSIDLQDFTVTEKAFPHLKFEAEAEANSYLHNGRLYQLKLNSQQLALNAVDLNSGETIKTYTATAADSISFRNSELTSQTGNQRPRNFKDTKQFLRRAASSDAALSVYQTPDELLLTVGGVRYVTPIGNIIAGVAVAAGGGSPDSLLEDQSMQLVYFESLFNEKFEHVNLEQGRLAIDYLSGFMDSVRNASLENVIPFDDYLVLGYYDSKAKQYILRKFKDDDF